MSIFRKSKKLSQFNFDFLQRLLLVALLGVLLVASDMAFQIFTPTVQAIETRYLNSEINVFRFWNGSVMYTVSVEKTYWIGLPLILTRFLNLSLPDPSNLTVSEGSRLIWSDNQLELNIAADNALLCVPIKNSAGKTEYLDLMPLNNSLQFKDNACVKLTYADVLDLNLIEVTNPVETHIDNDSIVVSTSLLINNTQPLTLVSNRFPLFQNRTYGNITAFTWLENGIEKQSHFYDVWNDWLWSPIYVSPNTFMNITVLATFEEKQ
jgi:hypothetical protein